MTCASCGYAAPPDFAFCPRCGSKLETRAAAAPAHEADRRTATVLFADLSGFTTLSERLDPEDVRALQSDLIHELSGAIQKYDGFVEKYIGDAVLAVFGAPVAHEDDAERALHAAVAMKERVRLLSERWQRRLGGPLELHIGVNTGPVVAGHVGTGASAAYGVTGDTVNTAARLQGEAGPGEVVVSEPTFRLTEHAFEFGAEDAVKLKGKREPVTVYRLLGPRSTPRAARGLGGYGLSTPLIGRQAELETLQLAFDRMLAGCTQVVSVVGEAGAGKSRLVSEFLVHQEELGKLAGAAVRRVVCYSTSEQTYGVVAALLREAYDLSPDDALDVARAKLTAGFESLGVDDAETAHLAGVLGHVLGLSIDDSVVQHLEPDQLERQLYMATRAVVERRLDQTALVLIIEDLHWADAASLELVAYLLERLGDRRLMVLVTFRAAPFEGLRAAHAERTLIRLAPLRSHECERLLAAWFDAAVAPLPDVLRHVIIERSGGNPLFLEEILRTLIGRGLLAQRDGRWEHRADPEISAVPLTLHGLLLAHIDRLPARARTVLQQAAVIGPVFDDALLNELNERAAVDDSLAMLVAAELVVRSAAEDESARRDGRTYRFRHGLLQEAVYQNLLVRRRTELHTRVGEALERLYGERPKRLEEIVALGHHWSLGEDRQRGAGYLVAAGDWARSLYANEDALRHYRRALDTLTQCEAGDASLPSVHERLGDVLAITGRCAEAAEHHRAAVGCYERVGNRSAHARQLRKIAELLWAGGDRTTAKSHLQDALALLEGGGDPIERAHLYQTMGRHAFRSGAWSAAVDWAGRALSDGESALEHATEAEPRRAAAEAVSHAHNTLGVALARMGRMREAVDHLERSVAIAFENELPRAACRGMANLGVLYSTLDPRRAIDTCTRGLETAKRIGDFALQSRLYSNLALAYCSLTNRCDEHGIGAAHAAIDLDRRLGQLDHLTVPLIVLAQIQQCHGSPVAALGHYHEALALAEQTGEAQLLYPCYDGLAGLYLEAGDEARAEQYMMQAQAVCERTGVDPETLVVLPFLD